MSGAINRLKFHLGQNVELCTNTTPEIIQRAIQSLMDKEDGKDTRAALKNQLGGDSRVGGIESGSASSAASPSSPIGPNPSSISSFFVPRTTVGSQPGIKSAMKKRKRQKPIGWLVSVFYGVMFLSTLPRQTHSTSLCLMLLLSLARGTKPPPLQN